ncbi:ABC-type molybdate transport system, substrate-binding protein [Rhizobiales bacterium GAS191]|nr:ABC-type molybdate transport system, substrate-binding protein [Rhizobiales bacterium GAS191]
MHRSIRVLLSSILLMAALGRADAGEIRLYGAGSLKEVMGELSSSYARTKGSAFTMQFGPSGLMRERIERGENVDVFASADMGHPLKLLRDARANMVVFFTRNLLCATALPALNLTPANLLDKLLDPNVKVGTSTPKADPAGDYTWAMFKLADTLRPGAFARLDAKAMQIYGGASNNGPVDGKDLAIAALASGKVDLTIGYCRSTRLRLSQLPGLVAVEIPKELSVGPEYGLALMKDASPDAVGFALFVMSTQGQDILARFGFKPVATPSTGS